MSLSLHPRLFLTNWYCISMCFIWAWKIRFLAILTLLWLLQFNGVGCVPRNITSYPHLHSHIAPLLMSMKHFYSASIDEATTMGCQFKHQVICELFGLNTYLLIVHLIISFPSQSKSMKPQGYLVHSFNKLCHNPSFLANISNFVLVPTYKVSCGLAMSLLTTLIS